MKNATIWDVAKKADVSLATVSKYLNKKRVSATSYNRIEEAIRELNYQVNDFARGLRTNTSKMIGLFVPSIDSILATSLFNEAEKQLMDYNYSLVLCNYRDSATVFVEKIAFIRQRMVDGVIILLSGQTNELIRQGLNELQQANIPYVLVNGQVDGIEADAVLADNVQAIHSSVSHLLQNGHRKIGMIMANRNSHNAKERMTGFCKAYADIGLTADEELLFDLDGEKNWELEAKERIGAFLQAHPELTALVLPGYRMTLIGINAIHEQGRKIGEDIALIGFDCDAINYVLHLPITYMRLPTDVIAFNAIELLINAITRKDKEAPKLIHIFAQTIEGKSVFKI